MLSSARLCMKPRRSPPHWKRARAYNASARDATRHLSALARHFSVAALFSRTIGRPNVESDSQPAQDLTNPIASGGVRNNDASRYTLNVQPVTPSAPDQQPAGRRARKIRPVQRKGRISITQSLRRVDRLLLRSRRILSRGGPSPGPLVGRPGPVPVVAPIRPRRSHRFRRLGAGGGGGRLVGLGEGSHRRKDDCGAEANRG